MIETTVELILMLAAVAGIAGILLASFYDIKKIRTDAIIRSSMRRLTLRRQQHVTIIITHVTDISELLRSLRQIKRSQYQQYDVVAVASSVSLTERRSILAASPVKNLRIYSPRHIRHGISTIDRAYGRSMHGDLVIVMKAGDQMLPLAIKRSVASLQHLADVDSVRFTGEMPIVDSMLGLYDAFAEMSVRTYRKAVAVLGLSLHLPAGFSGMYRAASLRAVAKNHRNLRAVDFAALGISSSLDLPPVRRTARTPMLFRLTFIVLAAYGAAVAALLQTPLPLLFMWAIVSIWLLAVIWSSDESRAPSKLALSVCVPIGMFVMVSGYIVTGALGIFSRKSF